MRRLRAIALPVVRHARARGAIAARLEPPGGDAVRDQALRHRARPPLAKPQVVGQRAHVVGVSLDFDALLAVVAQDLRRAL
jgi:hypothetical protein